MSSMRIRATLSPSRAGDFQNCPLLYRFRVVDKLPESPTPVMVRGTLVHSVLEDLFDAEAPARTLSAAAEMLPSRWQKLRAEDPRLAQLFTSEQASEEAEWLASCQPLLENYFSLEDPRWLEPEARELHIEHKMSDVTLGGIVDRLDVAPDGRIRVVDYKTGKSPSPHFEERALFQMKFYALVIWRTRGVLPTLLQLLYLGDGAILEYVPDQDDLVAAERKITALWQAIRRAIEQGEFLPRPSNLCRFCSFQAHCPEFGGTPPELPELVLTY